MIGHPDRATLEAFLLGRLVAGRRKDVFLHLLGGCAICQESMDPLTGAMFHPGAQEAELSLELDAAYDEAITAAWNKATAPPAGEGGGAGVDGQAQRVASG